MKPIRVREWLGLIVVTGSAQLLVQLIGFISGILVIRLLPVNEYAFYTLANTMLGAMTVLADGGIGAGVLSQGGRVWRDKDKLGAVVSTGMMLRVKFAKIALLASAPILFFLLSKHGASWLMSTLIMLSLVPAFFSSLSGTLLQTPLQLHQDIKPLQQYQLEANLGRLALLGLSMFLFPFAAVAIACAGASQLWNNWRLRKKYRFYANPTETPSIEHRSNLIRLVKRTLPGAVYFTFSSQLPVWFISIFGSSEGIAQVGALGRLASILSVFFVVFSTLIVPRFSRMEPHDINILPRYFVSQLFFLPLSLSIFSVAYYFPTQVLWFLGNSYIELSKELILQLLGSMTSLMAAAVYAMNVSRGHIIPALEYYLAIFALQILLAINLRLDTVSGVLTFSLVVNLFSYFVLLAYGAVSIEADRKKKRKPT